MVLLQILIFLFRTLNRVRICCLYKGIGGTPDEMWTVRFWIRRSRCTNMHIFLSVHLDRSIYPDMLPVPLNRGRSKLPKVYHVYNKILMYIELVIRIYFLFFIFLVKAIRIYQVAESAFTRYLDFLSFHISITNFFFFVNS